MCFLILLPIFLYPEQRLVMCGMVSSGMTPLFIIHMRVDSVTGINCVYLGERRGNDVMVLSVVIPQV